MLIRRFPWLALVACLVLPGFVGLAPGAVALAQPPDGPGFDVETRLAELTARVGLDAAQAQQARVILTDARQQLLAARASAAQGGPPMPERRRAILWQAEDRLWAILSCPQKDAFRLYIRERMAERLEHRAESRGGGASGHGPGGPGRGRRP
jgi:hypothetical protein